MTTTTHTTVQMTPQVVAQVVVTKVTQAPSGKVTNWGLAYRLANAAGDPMTDDYTDLVEAGTAKTQTDARNAIQSEAVRALLVEAVKAETVSVPFGADRTPTAEQLAEATQRAEAERAEAEAAKPKRQAKPKHAASTPGSDAWKALRDKVHTHASVDGKLGQPDHAGVREAIAVCLQARVEGVAWSALDLITRDAKVRGLNKLVWEAHQAARQAK